MSNYDGFSHYFVREALAGLASPLPEQEELFKYNYSHAWEDWKAIQMEIQHYPLIQPIEPQLQALFELARDCLYLLLGSGLPYELAKETIQEKWEAVQQATIEVQRNFTSLFLSMPKEMFYHFCEVLSQKIDWLIRPIKGEYFTIKPDAHLEYMLTESFLNLCKDLLSCEPFHANRSIFQGLEELYQKVEAYYFNPNKKRNLLFPGNMLRDNEWEEISRLAHVMKQALEACPTG